jgi:hypothetical protein
MITHKCTKCGQSYQDEDVEDYLCEPCVVERKAIAAKVDAQRAGIPRVPPKTDLQMYEEGPKFKGFLITK